MTGMPAARAVWVDWHRYSAQRPIESLKTMRSSLLISPMVVMSRVSVPSVALVRMALMA